MPDPEPLDRRSGYKTLLYVDPAGGTDYERILGIMENIDGPDGTTDEADVSAIDDEFEEVLSGLKRTGELTFDCLYDPNHETSQLLTDLWLQGHSPMPHWKLVYQKGGDDTDENRTEEDFYGWVKTLGRAIPRSGALSRRVAIRISGDPGYTGSGS